MFPINRRRECEKCDLIYRFSEKDVKHSVCNLPEVNYQINEHVQIQLICWMENNEEATLTELIFSRNSIDFSGGIIY